MSLPDPRLIGRWAHPPHLQPLAPHWSSGAHPTAGDGGSALFMGLSGPGHGGPAWRGSRWSDSQEGIPPPPATSCSLPGTVHPHSAWPSAACGTVTQGSLPPHPTRAMSLLLLQTLELCLDAILSRGRKERVRRAVENGTAGLGWHLPSGQAWPPASSPSYLGG